jgi:hypothetical protein
MGAWVVAEGALAAVPPAEVTGSAYASVVWITMVKPAAAAPTAACLTKGTAMGRALVATTSLAAEPPSEIRASSAGSTYPIRALMVLSNVCPPA